MKYHKIKYGKEYTVSGYFSKHTAEIQHIGIKEKKVLKDKDKSTLETKIQNQFKRRDLRYEKEKGKINAEIETKKAEENLKYLDDILKTLINSPINFSWESLKKTSEFKKKNPKNELEEKISKLKIIQKPKLKKASREPKETDSEFSPKFSLLEKLFQGLRRKKITRLKAEFDKKHKDWEDEKIKVANENDKLELAYRKNLEKSEKQKQNITR